MSKLFYYLQSHITSLTDEIQPELERELNSKQKNLVHLTFGEIHQKDLVAMEKICEQHTY